MKKDTQSRKYQLTINNPEDFTQEKVCEIIDNNFRSIVYYCMALEQGQTLHLHLYMAFYGGVRFSTIKKHFPRAHIEVARGSSQDNRDYILKEGHWADHDKSETKIEGTFFEKGDMPNDHQGISSDEAMIIERVQDGATNGEILREFPHYLRAMRDVEYIRQTLRAEEYRERWRDLEVSYIWGLTGVGKTRYVMEKYGYENVYAVTDYKHPFDGYNGEICILFDEYDSGFRIQDMNIYLDGYPVSLPARYSNKQAAYEIAYIVSNVNILKQYCYEQISKPDVWAAFIRRIHKVIQFMPDGSRREYETQDYLYGQGFYTEYPPAAPIPARKAVETDITPPPELTESTDTESNTLFIDEKESEEEK